MRKRLKKLIVACPLEHSPFQLYRATMFVRFRRAKTRLQASLIQNHWNDGRVRHEHITMLGVVDHPQTIAGRIAFWQRLHERLASLGNRVDAATQAKLLEHSDGDA
jgi:hypothetical protein